MERFKIGLMTPGTHAGTGRRNTLFLGLSAWFLLRRLRNSSDIHSTTSRVQQIKRPEISQKNPNTEHI